VLRAGTVLDTSGGQDFVRIFHAGFHDPDDWPNLPDEAVNALRYLVPETGEIFKVPRHSTVGGG
jgi:hypothetical protein